MARKKKQNNTTKGTIPSVNNSKYGDLVALILKEQGHGRVLTEEETKRIRKGL